MLSICFISVLPVLQMSDSDWAMIIIDRMKKKNCWLTLDYTKIKTKTLNFNNTIRMKIISVLITHDLIINTSIL